MQSYYNKIFVGSFIYNTLSSIAANKEATEPRVSSR